jgi:hypothetical protein
MRLLNRSVWWGALRGGGGGGEEVVSANRCSLRAHASDDGGLQTMTMLEHSEVLRRDGGMRLGFQQDWRAR